MDPRPISLEFHSKRVFHGQRFDRQPDGGWTYFEVKGRLRANGRASGFLYFVSDPYDPPGSPNLPECSTGGQLYVSWVAKR